MSHSYKLTDAIYISRSFKSPNKLYNILNISKTNATMSNIKDYDKYATVAFKSNNFQTFIKTLIPCLKFIKHSLDNKSIIIICCDNCILKPIVIAIAYHMIYKNMTYETTLKHFGMLINNIGENKYDHYLKSLDSLIKYKPLSIITNISSGSSTSSNLFSFNSS